jgi:hypothetical protein
MGRPGPLPTDGVVVHSDAEACAVVSERVGPAWRSRSWDCSADLGGRGDEAGAIGKRSPDLGVADVDGRHWFVARDRPALVVAGEDHRP